MYVRLTVKAFCAIEALLNTLSCHILTGNKKGKHLSKPKELDLKNCRKSLPII